MLVIRAGWQWVAAEGPVELARRTTCCLASTRSGCGSCCVRSSPPPVARTTTGPTYDKVMADERRTAVLVTPDRIYANPA